MSRTTRRAFLLSSAGAVASAGGLGAFAFRLHRRPQRGPYLTDAHLAELAGFQAPAPRVLFIGNSMVLRHDVPARVASLTGISTAMAAANGARLIETVRIERLQPVLTAVDWSAIVLQDFTKTPLRGVDRFASERAMTWIASQTSGARVLLFPPWPSAAGSAVYQDAGPFTTTPSDPQDYARRTMGFYTSVADRHGFSVAPVPSTWLSAGNPALYAEDNHHASAAGAALVAEVLASELEKLL